MFRNTYQSGFLSILYSIGSKPLSIWDKNGEWWCKQGVGMRFSRRMRRRRAKKN